VADPARWLFLIHQIPPRPNYLRVKVGRRLQGLGAVAVKNSVYVLPRSDQALEDFQWVRREILAGGGEAWICEARFVEGLTDGEVEALFHAAREADYAELIEEARRLQAALARKRAPLGRDAAGAALQRLRKRLAEVAAIDHLGAGGRETAEGLLSAIEARLRPPAEESEARGPSSLADVRGRTWVTRAGVRVDRIASAWLIRRFIDPGARIDFVAAPASAPAGALRFDMSPGDFTHEGDRCTFEVLVRRFGLQDPGLRPLAEMIHDIDLKDGKFARPETPGFERLIEGILLRQTADEPRLAEGTTVLDALYESFRRRG
jgi:hypothetical protein